MAVAIFVLNNYRSAIMNRLIAWPLIMVCCAVADADEPHSLFRSRQQFAKAMDQVKEGMTPAEVRSLLGPPDDIMDQKGIWRYGTSGHLTVATLGEVYFDPQWRVWHVIGKGKPLSATVIREAELRRVLVILGDISSYQADEGYNPRTVIRAVNELQPLGKDKSLAIIDEFLRVTQPVLTPGRDGIFLVLRTLFDVPDDPGFMPPMRVGIPSPAEPENKKLFPRFPISLQGDIPLLLVKGYSGTGIPQEPEEHVTYFRQHGRLRTRPLVPTDKPMEALAALVQSSGWKVIDREDERWQLQNEMLNLLDSVYFIEADRMDMRIPFGPEAATRRQRILNDMSSLKILWNAAENRYTFLDGKSLPPRQPYGVSP
jgi:hypothetical protein